MSVFPASILTWTYSPSGFPKRARLFLLLSLSIVILSMNFFLFLLPWKRESFAKIKTFLLRFQIFPKFFSNFFETPSLCLSLPLSPYIFPRSKSGAKIILFILQSQTFRGLLYQHTYQQIWINTYITNIYLVDNSYLFLLKRQIII